MEIEPVTHSENLLPCPFCGGDAETFLPTCKPSDPYRDGDRLFPVARCKSCLAAGWGDNEDYTGKTAIAAWNRRADLCRPSVRVKLLEWGGRGTWSNQPCYHADSAFGWLMIVDHTTHGNGFRVYPPWEEPAHSETYPSLEAAKAAAHADYEARVLAALEGDAQ